MRILLSVMLCLLLLTSIASAEQNLPAFIKEHEPAIMIIRTYDQAGRPLGQGSGFFISADGQFITNRHVLERAFSATAETPDGKKYSIERIIGRNPELDLVKGQVAGSNLVVPYLKLADSLPEKGTKVIVFGNPEGMKFSISEGIVAAIQEFPNKDFPDISQKGTFIQFTAPISPGSSGGPILNEKGEVVGISTWVLNPNVTLAQNVNFAIPSTMINTLTSQQNKPLLAEEGPPSAPVQAGKPLVGYMIFYGSNLSTKLKDQKEVEELIAEKLEAKFVPKKFIVNNSEFVKSDFTKYFLQESGLNALPDGAEIEKQYIDGFAEKKGYDYLIIYSIEMADNVYINPTYFNASRAAVALDMDIRVLDRSIRDYSYAKVIRCLGTSNGSLFASASSQAAILNALQKGLFQFAREYSTTQLR